MNKQQRVFTRQWRMLKSVADFMKCQLPRTLEYDNFVHWTKIFYTGFLFIFWKFWKLIMYVQHSTPLTRAFTGRLFSVMFIYCSCAYLVLSHFNSNTVNCINKESLKYFVNKSLNGRSLLEKNIFRTKINLFIPTFYNEVPVFN